MRTRARTVDERREELMTKHGFATRAVTAWMLIVGLSACGGGGGDGPVTPSTPPPTPAATVTAVGAGALVIHPSLDSRFGFALETPMRIAETAGGTADWNFARFQTFLAGREVERNEIGSDVIRAAGFGRVAASSNQVVTAVFRINSDKFDRIDISLGFGDLKDARQFTVAVPGTTFTGVNISVTPLFAPADGSMRAGR
jgi:hypothetical protein